MTNDPVNNLIARGNTKETEANAIECNPSQNETGKDSIIKNVKRWLIIPTLGFHGGGFGMLMFLTFSFLMDEQLSPWVWPAMIAAFAGIPYEFASNIKTLINVFTSSS